MRCHCIVTYTFIKFASGAEDLSAEGNRSVRLPRYELREFCELHNQVGFPPLCFPRYIAVLSINCYRIGFDGYAIDNPEAAHSNIGTCPQASPDSAKGWGIQECLSASWHLIRSVPCVLERAVSAQSNSRSPVRPKCQNAKTFWLMTA